MQRDEKYITLKRIADVLEENYSTIRHYKRRFNVYLDARVFGRKVRYSTQNVELFRDILDFKEDGYTNDEIETILMDKKIIRQEDKEIMGQADKEVSEQVSKEVSGQVSERVSGQADKEVSEQVSGQAGKQVSEQVSEQAVKEVSEEAGKEVSGQVSEQVSKQTVEEIYQRVYKKIKGDLGKEIQINSLEANLDEHLKKLTENINTSLAMLHENQQALYQAITQVNKRVVSMEAELGLESVEDLQMDCLGTGDLKINMEGMGLIFPLVETSEDPAKEESSLEIVLQSMVNGIPDREAVVSWLNMMRSKSPCPSYADLATRLDKAEVPTLSGRGGWNRSTLSKMVSEKPIMD